MLTPISILAELIVTAGVVCATQFLVLAFRNPHRHAWLRTTFAESVAVIGIVMGLALTISLLISTLVGSGVNVLVAMGIGIAVPVAVALLNERLFHLRARLRRADAGQSPFTAPDANTGVEAHR